MITPSDQPQPCDASPIDDESAAPERRVLIADEEPAVLWAAEQTLRQDGFATATAFDGQGAMLAAERHGPFNLLVTNLYLPLMTGLELAVRLRLRDPDLKVLYLIGRGDRLLLRQILLSADEAFLDIPCSPRDLLDAVRNLLHRTRRPQRTSP